ncbi:PiggyBac transposable element-derived protein 3 [Trichinella zimbabwensis]|uniref:PiggyBac transposable element-derived protein 3 n=1 Tax=Trichinella zimbabwensis TaxID=268475 RepID=A0A0V1HU17_9BILA|nr:PiggyBac transposable element-derived protein 3 [Trichinella zimbabwensis]
MKRLSRSKEENTTVGETEMSTSHDASIPLSVADKDSLEGRICERVINVVVLPPAAKDLSSDDSNIEYLPDELEISNWPKKESRALPQWKKSEDLDMIFLIEQLQPNEIRQFIGFTLLSGNNYLPEARHYWSTKLDMGAQVAVNTTSRNCFMEIKKHIHMADNKKLVKGDKMSKVTPLYSLLNASLVQYGIFHEQLSVDESRVPYFGCHRAKMFMKSKPIRQRKECQASNTLLSTRVVTDMVDVKQESSKTTRHILFFDSFFTSYYLLIKIAELNIRAPERSDHIAPSEHAKMMLPDKELMKQKRGALDYRSDGKFHAVKWNDNAIVNIASNYMTHRPLRTAQRRMKSQRTEIPKPNLV